MSKLFYLSLLLCRCVRREIRGILAPVSSQDVSRVRKYSLSEEFGSCYVSLFSRSSVIADPRGWLKFRGNNVNPLQAVDKSIEGTIRILKEQRHPLNFRLPSRSFHNPSRGRVVFIKVSLSEPGQRTRGMIGKRHYPAAIGKGRKSFRDETKNFGRLSSFRPSSR